MYFRAFFCLELLPYTPNLNIVKAFISEVVSEYILNHTSFEKLCLIVPSKRAGIFLINELINQLEEPKFAPLVYSIEEFTEELATSKKANTTHQLVSLYELYCQHLPKDKRDPFELFLQWAPKLLKDFSDIDAYCLNSEAVLSNLGSYYALENILEKEQNSSFDESFWKIIPALYESFTTQLAEQQLGTIGMLYREAVDTIEIYLEHTTQYHYFIGFNALNKAEERMFQAFLSEDKAKIVWDLDEALYNDKVHAAGRFIQEYQSKWTYYRKTPYAFKETGFSEEKEIAIHGLSGNIEQAKEVGRLIEQLKTEDSGTAIIFGNEHLLLPVLGHLPHDCSDWNVTMGYPIGSLPLVRFFQDCVEFHKGLAEGNYSYETLERVLHFSMIRSSYKDTEIKVTEFLSHLYASHSYEINHELIRPLQENEVGVILFQKCTNAHDLLRLLGQLSKHLKDQFTAVSHSLELSSLEGIDKVLRQLENHFNHITFEFSISAFSVLFAELLGQQNIDFKGDPKAKFQLMGMLESRVLDFENLIITDVNEGVLPVGKNDQSFFPFAIKKHFGLPTFLDNDAIYSYHFYRLIQRAKKVHILYNAQSEGLNAGEQSRFVRQLLLMSNPNHKVSEILSTPKIDIKRHENRVVEKTKSMIERLNLLAKSGFSPTSLSTYLKNPVDFYDRYLLGIKDNETLGPVLSNFNRGTLVHNTLEDLYKPYLNQLLTLEIIEEMERKVNGVMHANYVEIYDKSKTIRGENKLILEAYEQAIKTLLTQEKVRINKGNEIEVIALEEKFTIPLTLKEVDTEINIVGTIDRIDRVNGILRIIDYKTGLVKKKALEFKSWDQFYGDYHTQPLFQVLLYAWAKKEEINLNKSIDIGVISLKSPKEYMLPFYRKEVPSGDPQITTDFLNEIDGFISSLIQEIFDLKHPFISTEE